MMRHFDMKRYPRERGKIYTLFWGGDYSRGVRACMLSIASLWSNRVINQARKYSRCFQRTASGYISMEKQ